MRKWLTFQSLALTLRIIQFNTQKLYTVLTLCWLAVYETQNKEQTFPYTTSTVRLHITEVQGVYCAVRTVSLYRVSRREYARLTKNVPYVKVHRYNPKHLYPKLNGYGENGERILKLWQLLHTYWLPNTYWNCQKYVVSVMLISVLNI